MTCFNDTLSSWGKDYKSQVTGHHMKCLSLHWLQIFKPSRAQQPFLKPEIPKCLNLTYSRGIAHLLNPAWMLTPLGHAASQICPPKGASNTALGHTAFPRQSNMVALRPTSPRSWPHPLDRRAGVLETSGYLLSRGTEGSILFSLHPLHQRILLQMAE